MRSNELICSATETGRDPLKSQFNLMSRSHFKVFDVDKLLAVSGRACFISIVAGQWLFISYLLAYYIGPALSNGLRAWSGNGLSTGYIPEDDIGNTAVAAHIFVSLIIMGGGALQLSSRIRNRFRRFHRWNGRVYLSAVMVASLAGFYMVWVRGNPQAGTIENVGTTLGGLLIILCGVIALRQALARDFAAHSRWALRLFLVASGVWFIRVGYGWFFYFDGGAEHLKAFSIFISYAQYILPLCILEIYFLAKANKGKTPKLMVSGGLLAVSVFTILGTALAAYHIWYPRVFPSSIG